MRYAQMPQMHQNMGQMPTGVPPMMAAQYGYAQLLHGQGSRKNATRESTQQLKIWLKEHQKNPYPTKGEKIMLALMSGKFLSHKNNYKKTRKLIFFDYFFNIFLEFFSKFFLENHFFL